MAEVNSGEIRISATTAAEFDACFAHDMTEHAP